MTARLRELADALRRGDCNDAECMAIANEINQILDADGDGGAAGEKVCIDAVGRVDRDMTGELGINWVLEGGIHALEEGTWLLCADREITDDEGYGELYTHPARSGGVSDADVETAWAVFRQRDVWPEEWNTNDMRAALTHFAKRAEVGGDAEDAAKYRWLREHVQPYRNGNPSPHAIVKVSLGIGADQRERSFDLIDKVTHVGVVTLDQAIDAARKGERHDSIGS